MSALEPKLSQKYIQKSNPHSELKKWFCKIYRCVNLKLSIWHVFAVYWGWMTSQYGLLTPYIECVWTKTVLTKKCVQKSNPHSELKKWFCKIYRCVNLKLSIWHVFAVYWGRMPSQYGLPTPYIECVWTKTVSKCQTCTFGQSDMVSLILPKITVTSKLRVSYD